MHSCTAFVRPVVQAERPVSMRIVCSRSEECWHFHLFRGVQLWGWERLACMMVRESKARLFGGLGQSDHHPTERGR